MCGQQNQAVTDDTMAADSFPRVCTTLRLRRTKQQRKKCNRKVLGVFPLRVDGARRGRVHQLTRCHQK